MAVEVNVCLEPGQSEYQVHRAFAECSADKIVDTLHVEAQPSGPHYLCAVRDFLETHTVRCVQLGGFVSTTNDIGDFCELVDQHNITDVMANFSGCLVEVIPHSLSRLFENHKVVKLSMWDTCFGPAAVEKMLSLLRDPKSVVETLELTWEHNFYHAEFAFVSKIAILIRDNTTLRTLSIRCKNRDYHAWMDKQTQQVWGDLADALAHNNTLHALSILMPVSALREILQRNTTLRHVVPPYVCDGRWWRQVDDATAAAVQAYARADRTAQPAAAAFVAFNPRAAAALLLANERGGAAYRLPPEVIEDVCNARSAVSDGACAASEGDAADATCVCSIM